MPPCEQYDPNRGLVLVNDRIEIPDPRDQRRIGSGDVVGTAWHGIVPFANELFLIFNNLFSTLVGRPRGLGEHPKRLVGHNKGFVGHPRRLGGHPKGLGGRPRRLGGVNKALVGNNKPPEGLLLNTVLKFPPQNQHPAPQQKQRPGRGFGNFVKLIELHL